MQAQLSVIVPVYNVEPFLRRCLQSICDQTYKLIEIICIDDGSTDGSAAIIEEFARKDARIKVIKQKNQGLSAARNAGIMAATAPWITGVDSDDYLSTGIYEEAMKYAENHDLVCFDALRVTETGEPINNMFERLPYLQTIDDKSALFQLTMVSFWNKIWRTEHIRKSGITFPTGLWYGDAAFFYKYVSIAKNAILIPSFGYYYVKRKGSIIWNSKRQVDRVLDYIKISVDVSRFFIQLNQQETQKEALLWIWRRNYIYAESTMPKAHHKRLKLCTRETLQQLPESLAYIAAGMQDLLHIYPVWLRLFYTRTATRIAFSLFCIPVFAIKHAPDNKLGNVRPPTKFTIQVLGVNIIKTAVKSNFFTIKLLGIPIYKRAIENY